MTPDPIPVAKLSTISMVVSGEKTITKVIDDGVVKEWVGIGWVALRPATDEDRKTIPAVAR